MTPYPTPSNVKKGRRKGWRACVCVSVVAERTHCFCRTTLVPNPGFSSLFTSCLSSRIIQPHLLQTLYFLGFNDITLLIFWQLLFSLSSRLFPPHQKDSRGWSWAPFSSLFTCSPLGNLISSLGFKCQYHSWQSVPLSSISSVPVAEFLVWHLITQLKIIRIFQLSLDVAM